jgi:tRNA(Ile)-lysidine synthase
VASSGLDKKIFAASEILRDEDDYLEREVDGIFEIIGKIDSCGDKLIVEIKVGELDDLHIALKRRLIRRGIVKVAGGLDQFEKKHIDEILNLTESEEGEKRIHLPHDLETIKCYDRLIIRKRDDDEATHESFESGLRTTLAKDQLNWISMLNVPGVTHLCEGTGSIEAEIIDIESIAGLKTSPNEAFVDYSKCASLHVRYRREGDRFTPYGMKGTKKLKDYFIDRKVPRYMRDSIPIIVSDSGVVWVLGFTIDDNVKITDETKKVLHLTYTN